MTWKRLGNDQERKLICSYVMRSIRGARFHFPGTTTNDWKQVSVSGRIERRCNKVYPLSLGNTGVWVKQSFFLVKLIVSKDISIQGVKVVN